MGVIAQTTTTADNNSGAAVGLVILVCIVICVQVWKRKGGNPLVGGLVGWVLGPLGILLVLVAKPKAAKARASSSVPPAPAPIRPASFPLPPRPDAIAFSQDRFGESSSGPSQ